MLQPKIEDSLSLGSLYEETFDQFEAFFGLVVFYEKYKEDPDWSWAPVGRFGWKNKYHDTNVLSQFIGQANLEKEKWEPFSVGFFDSNYSNFKPAADAYLQHVRKRGWH